MEKYLNKIMIVDGSYMLHRALHTPSLQELQTSTGIKSGGVFGVLRMLQAEMKLFPSYFPIFCWDKGLSERRVNLYPDYKHNRERLEADALIAAGVDQRSEEDKSYLEEYHRQRSDVIMILKSLGIPSLLIPGWEGDDLQYLLSTVCEEGVVISDDKDMIQLVSPTIKIRRAMRDELIDWEKSDEYYHHPRFTIRKSIVGDGSDNIPKCASGVGDKGADDIAKMIVDKELYTSDQWKSFLEDYVKEGGKLTKKVQSLLENWDQFLINYQLTDLRLVTPPAGMESMIKDLIKTFAGHSNVMTAYQLIGKYEMRSIFPDQIIGMVSLSFSQVIK